MYSRSRKIASAIAAVGLFSFIPSGRAQSTTNWSGTNSTDWTDPGNWSALVPGNTTIADFNGPGSGNVLVSLGGTTQTLGAIQFDTASAAAYDLGVTSGDTFSLGDGSINVTGPLGVISVSSLVANAEEIDANISLTNAAPFISAASSSAPLNLGAVGGTGILTLASGSALSLIPTGGGIINLNDSIQGSANVTLNSSASGIVVFSGASTYTGNTTQSSGSSLAIQIGSSTDTSDPSTYISGPFGKSTIVANNTSNSSFEAVKADRTIANPWTLNASGVTFANASTGAFNLTLAGPINYTAGTGRSFTAFTYGKTLTVGSATTPSTLTLGKNAVSLGITPAYDATLGAATIVINDQIVDGSGSKAVDTLAYNANGGQGVLVLTNGNSTYSGGTTFNGGGAGTNPLTVLVGASSSGNPGSVTSGPFGTGAITMNASNEPPIFEARGADRVIANALTLSSGFWAGGDASGAHNITFLAGFSDSKIITNNIPSGAALILGASASPSTITLAAPKFQSQVGSGAGGVTIINDLMAGTSVTFQQGGVYYINNAANSYTGNTTLTGNGTVGSGATIAGTGNVGTGVSVLTVSSTTAASQGGIVSPGGDGATNLTGIGTLVVPNIALDPLGRYVYQFDPTNAAAGGTTNDLISIVGNLNVSALSSTGKFDLNLAPLAAGAPQPQYTLATFASIPGVTAGSDVTADISFSGTTPAGYTPTVTVNGTGTALLLNFAPVPEPGTLSLLGIAGLGMIRRRRR